MSGDNTTVLASQSQTVSWGSTDTQSVKPAIHHLWLGPIGRFQRLGIIGQSADRTSDRRRRYVLSRAKAGLGQSPCTLFGAVCVPRVCRRDRAGFGAGSKSVLRHWPSTLSAGIPPTRTWSPPAEGSSTRVWSNGTFQPKARALRIRTLND